MFAVIVRHAPDQSFTMILKIKATTYGDLPVSGKGGSRILFSPSKARRSSMQKRQNSTSGLAGGSFEVDNQQWISGQGRSEAAQDLGEIDLEAETQMRRVLLLDQGPGAGKSPFLSSLEK